MTDVRQVPQVKANKHRRIYAELLGANPKIPAITAAAEEDVSPFSADNLISDGHYVITLNRGGTEIMVRLNLEELLLKNGRSKYWLVSKLESNYTIINRMINGQTEGIMFKTIDRLLEIFNCSIEELFIDDNKSARF